ncbi:hypothetical protein ACJRO7_018506 [Eucalyptus globulus]|uniref:Bifunctional inhibitor/plant lipid transfer protein/seed storage helical domain-containing protein n=1 Tax=Eucalyptus globulus TaxID=34317 RepID=A0ABD3KY84_EUCGL
MARCRRHPIPTSVLAATVIAVALSSILGSSLVSAADSTMSCINRLVPCYQYLNSTAKPPASCCNPLKADVAATIHCLCNMYGTPGMLQKYNVNVTQVLRIGQGCGINSTTSVCKESAQSPASPGAANANSNSGANRVWTGISWFLLLIWASTMLY